MQQKKKSLHNTPGPLKEDTSQQTEEQDEDNKSVIPDANINYLDELALIEEEEESQFEDIDATETAAESEYCPETDAESIIEDTIIPTDNADPEMPEQHTIPTPLEKVGCFFVIL